ncbi:hypothetical protein LWI29_022615 [Acer saccharum]|uniref:Uncharacterized protein n=1 Tax=Acer saccharum TaxID=4024 RepID=A0AA39T928_ACESA|nr:hypothetical protein LWI29_022615 [Acer saccharum]
MLWQGKQLAVCSAATKSSVILCLESLIGMERFQGLDCFLAGDDVKEKKPDPSIYLTAAKRLGISEKDCLVVEDSVIGLQAATKAGMSCVITYTSSTAEQDFKDAIAIYPDLSDIRYDGGSLQGTDAIEGISLYMDDLEDIYLSSHVFDKMYNLRFLLFSSLLPSNFSPRKLVKLALSGSNIKQLWNGSKHASKLKQLILNYCPSLTMIPDLLDFPSLEEINLSNCNRLVDLPSSVQYHNNLQNLDLSGYINVTKFPLISGNIESLNLSETAIKKVPSSIQSLTKLVHLDLSECKSLEHISTGICKLKSLRNLRLNVCYKLKTGPKILETMEFLRELDLRRTAIKELPSSIEQLKGLQYLALNECRNLERLPKLPEGLECLEAMDCEQLCQVLDASEFVRCINSKSHDSTYKECVEFIFTNSLNLKAVSNVFEELLRIMQLTEKESNKPSNQFSIYLPRSKIPEWFRFQSLESSIKIRVLRNYLVDRKFMGFAICAVLSCDDYNSRGEHYMLGVYCVFEIYYDHMEICRGGRCYSTHRVLGRPGIFMDSDHVLVGYCSFSSFHSSFQNPEKLRAGDNDYVDISIKFKSNYDGHNQLKRCVVHPICAQEIIGSIIEVIGETSGRRGDSSDENEEVEHIQSDASINEDPSSISLRAFCIQFFDLLCCGLRDLGRGKSFKQLQVISY